MIWGGGGGGGVMALRVGRGSQKGSHPLSDQLVNGSVCSVQCAARSVQCAACSMQHAVTARSPPARSPPATRPQPARSRPAARRPAPSWDLLGPGRLRLPTDVARRPATRSSSTRLQSLPARSSDKLSTEHHPRTSGLRLQSMVLE